MKEFHMNHILWELLGKQVAGCTTLRLITNTGGAMPVVPRLRLGSSVCFAFRARSQGRRFPVLSRAFGRNPRSNNPC